MDSKCCSSFCIEDSFHDGATESWAPGGPGHNKVISWVNYLETPLWDLRPASCWPHCGWPRARGGCGQECEAGTLPCLHDPESNWGQNRGGVITVMYVMSDQTRCHDFHVVCHEVSCQVSSHLRLGDLSCLITWKCRAQSRQLNSRLM